MVDTLNDLTPRVAFAESSPSLLASDATANDSDKTFTVTSGKVWEIQSIFVTLVTTATAGNRQMQVEIDNGTSVYLVVPVGAVQAASVTRHYSLAHGLPDLTAMRNTLYLLTPFPKLVLPAGHRIRVYDAAAVDAAADDMTVRILGTER